jgi:hypothetical protein
MNINLNMIFEKTGDKVDAFEFAQRLGLINVSNRIRRFCGGNLNIERGKIRLMINARLRCKKKYVENPFQFIRIQFLKLSICQLLKLLNACIYIALTIAIKT